MVARLCWALADTFLDLGYRLAHGVSYRAYISRMNGR